MESKSKIFQPKVIIGSITSFVVAAVGIIAVFFPNLLNLEKSSMSEGQFLLSDDEKTHKKLWEFLDKNQGKVVQLEIAYCADFEFTRYVASNNKEGREFQSYNFRAIDFTPRWFFGFGGKNEWQTYGIAENLEKFAKKYNLSLKYIEGLTREDISYVYNRSNEDIQRYSGGVDPNEAYKETYYYVNDEWTRGNGNPLYQAASRKEIVARPPAMIAEIASFTTFHYGNDTYPNVVGVNLQNGGIGFGWKDENDDSEYPDIKSYDILISHPSNKNKKYIWVMGFENTVYQYLDKTSSLAKQAKSTCKAKQINTNEMSEYDVKEDLLKGWGGSTLGYIKGTFFIHDKEHEDGNGLWRVFEMGIESNDYSRDKIELEPFDKKDMELRKY